MSPAGLWSIVTRIVADWHPSVRALVDAAEVDAAFPDHAPDLHQGRRLAGHLQHFLGDAIHPMTAPARTPRSGMPPTWPRP
jgi:hypothetical protein